MSDEGDSTTGVERAERAGRGLMGTIGKSSAIAGIATLGAVATAGGVGVLAIGSHRLASGEGEPSFVSSSLAPAVKSGTTSISDFASASEENGRIIGWGALALVGTIGMSMIPSMHQMSFGQLAKNLMKSTIMIGVSAVIGLGLATWAQRGFKGDEFLDSFVDTFADIAKLFGGSVVDFAQFMGGEFKDVVTSLFGNDVEYEFGTTTVAQADGTEIELVNFETSYNIPAGQEMMSIASGTIVMASADGVEGDDRSMIVIDNGNGVYTVLRGLDGVTADMVGTELTQGQQIPGVTSSGQVAHQTLVGYQQNGEGPLRVTPVDPSVFAPDQIASNPDVLRQAIADSKAKLGGLTESTLFHDHIAPNLPEPPVLAQPDAPEDPAADDADDVSADDTAAPEPDVTSEPDAAADPVDADPVPDTPPAPLTIDTPYGTAVGFFTRFETGVGHGVRYETDEAAQIEARSDMTILHVEDGTMIVQYDDDTFGVYRNVDGLDASLAGQTFEAGQMIPGTETGGQYSYSLVVEREGENGVVQNFVVDPIEYSTDEMMNDPARRAEAITNTENTINAKGDPSYYTHIRPITTGMPLNHMEVFQLYDDPHSDPDAELRGDNAWLAPQTVTMHDFGEPVSVDAPGTVLHVGDMPGFIPGTTRHDALVIDHGEGVYSVRSRFAETDPSIVGQQIEATDNLNGFSMGVMTNHETWIRGEDGNVYRVDTVNFPVETLVGDSPEAAEARQDAIQHSLELTDGLVGARRNITVPDRELTNIPHTEPDAIVSTFGLDGDALSLGVGTATDSGLGLLSDVDGVIIDYDFSDEEGPAGKGLLIQHGEDTGVFTQYLHLAEVGNPEHEKGFVSQDTYTHAITGAYTERRLVVVDPRDGESYYVDPQAYDIDRLVQDPSYRIEAVEASKQLIADHPELQDQITNTGYELPDNTDPSTSEPVVATSNDPTRDTALPAPGA